MKLRDVILDIIRAEPGLNTLEIGDRVEARYADVPPGWACRTAIRLLGPDSLLAFLLSPQPSLGGIFVALEQLENEKLIRWQSGEPRRGGRRLRHFYPV